MDVPLGLDLVIIRQAVDFVDEDFEVDLRVDAVGPGHGEMKPRQGLHIIILQEGQKLEQGH